VRVACNTTYICSDVKPANILYRRENGCLYVVLADFDHATFFEISSYGQVGTIPYLPPEMLTGCPQFDFESDVWSAGVVFCEVTVTFVNLIVQAVWYLSF
jgi:serine/threonine protein kinase